MWQQCNDLYWKFLGLYTWKNSVMSGIYDWDVLICAVVKRKGKPINEIFNSAQT